MLGRSYLIIIHAFLGTGIGLPLHKISNMVRLLLCVFSLLTFLGCQNSSTSTTEGHQHHSAIDTPKTPADSLYVQVMGAHDLVMPKMGKVRGAQKRAQAILDSIATLSTSTTASLAAYKKALEALVSDLNYADYAMDQWMMEFNLDSGKNNMEARIAYLQAELDKVSKVKEAVLSSLAKADTVLKK